MKTDYHCHILPGLDDGAQDIEESVFLCRKLVEWGYERAICTPHSSYRYHNSPSTVLPAYIALLEALEKEGVELLLFPSMEYRIIPEVWPIDNLLLEPWDGNHVLIEFPIRGRDPFGNLDPVVEIKRLVNDGFKPVLAHPERYHYMDMEELARLRDLGCEFQMNLSAPHGFYDEETSRRSRCMQEKGWYSYTGTDLHNKRYTDFYDAILLDNGEL